MLLILNYISSSPGRENECCFLWRTPSMKPACFVQKMQNFLLLFFPTGKSSALHSPIGRLMQQHSCHITQFLVCVPPPAILFALHKCGERKRLVSSSGWFWHFLLSEIISVSHGLTCLRRKALVTAAFSTDEIVLLMGTRTFWRSRIHGKFNAFRILLQPLVCLFVCKTLGPLTMLFVFLL